MKTFSAIHRAVFPVGELLLGMGLSQLLATVQVHLSNLRLLSEMAAVAAAGFQPVPNLHIMPLLAGMGSAFGGGVFFTFSVGAGLSLLAAAAGAAAAGGASRRVPVLAAAGLIWAAALLAVNGSGFNLWASLYLAVIPPPVFAVAWGFLRGERPVWRPLLLTRALPIALLAAGWFTQYDPHLFIDLRDHLLMSNPVGERVSSFYYRYTLYPAEAFKSRQQRQINALRLETPAEDHHRAPVAQALIRNDWLPVASATGLVAAIEAGEERLRFSENGEPLAEVQVERFLADPRAVLDRISEASDRWGPFRSLTFWSVLLAFPVALFLLVFALLRLVLGLAAAPRGADLATAALCLMLGSGILIGFAASREGPPRPDGFATALASGSWQKQAAALRAVHETGADICTLAGWRDLQAAAQPQVRYWLCKALAGGRCPEASAALMRLLADPHLNVRTMALESLAERRERGVRERVATFIVDSRDWYDQLYAYRALRRLGWTQTGAP
ncbi:MAG: HEAT repeat domain-containing protein [Desulfobacterales bacterium]